MLKPNKLKLFLDTAYRHAEESTCLSRQVGAVIVKDNHILATGYNGSPENCVHCKDLGCLRKQLKVKSGTHMELCRGAHAEQNAINFAAKHGVSIDNSILICTTYPCSMCAKSIINAGIKTVYYTEGYPDDLTALLFKEAQIKLFQI